MTNAGYLMSNLVGGAVAGAIGAGVSQNADYPVLKGAVITGLVTAALSAVMIAVADSAPKQIGVNGLSNVRWP